jgi:carboxyl-terminal processing protease
MLPASNRGAGQNMGFPDVCNTPTPAGPVPIPYPNVALNAQASPFSQIVRISGLNALNMLSRIPMTSGDEAGSAHPFVKQAGAYTMGNPIVSIEGMPAINLTCLTTGNNMNNAVGCVAVPSVTGVSYTMVPTGAVRAATSARSHDRLLDAEGLAQLDAAMRQAPLQARALSDGVGYLRIGTFTSALPLLAFRAIDRLLAEGLRALVLDLRGSPGGDTEAMRRLCEDFLPRDAVIVRRLEPDGDELVVRARHDAAYRFPLVLLVDRTTASAAELFAGCLRCHGRAALVGEPTYGKGTLQRVLPAPAGTGVLYASVARCCLPDGSELEGRGVVPDRHVAAGRPDEDTQLAVALAVARQACAASPGSWSTWPAAPAACQEGPAP